MSYLHKKKLFRIMVFTWIIMSFVVPVFADSYQPITKIDLGVSNLSLEIGESYTFQVVYEPEKPIVYSLNWFITDESVIKFDKKTLTITALQPGEAGIFAESFDGVSSAYCFVTVNGFQSKDVVELKSGVEFQLISKDDLDKISANSILRYISFIEKANFTEETYQNVMKRIFSVSALVEPGTENEESLLAYNIGMSDATPLEQLNVVALQGTLAQILEFAKNNENLKDIFELDNYFITDPVFTDFSSESVAKAVNLQGYTEGLTSVSTVHNLGYKGAGSTIAIIDTGVNVKHEQFTGRIAAQSCFSSEYVDGDYTYRSVCGSSNSAVPSNAYAPANFNHGSHVAGIAAGKSGIAPEAKIVAVQAFTEMTWECSSDSLDYKYYACPGKDNLCCSSVIDSNSQIKAYNYLLNLKLNGTDITAVNMSYGGIKSDGTGYDSTCDNDFRYSFFKNLIAAGMVPVVAAGNNAAKLDSNYNPVWGEWVGAPSCLSNAFTVGALADQSSPKLTNFSNHNSLVDIAAPGAHILSAFYAYEEGSSTKECSTGGNCYGFYDGTSMATPMVSGALAIIKQIYPYNSPAALKYFLTNTTKKTVNYRLSPTCVRYYNENTPDNVNYCDFSQESCKNLCYNHDHCFIGCPTSVDIGTGTTFSYSTPVLNFANVKSHILSSLSISQSNVEGYDQGISLRIARDKLASAYMIAVYDVTNGKTITPTIDKPTHSGDWTTIKIHGSSLENGNIYSLTIYKYHKVGTFRFLSNTVTVYGMPNTEIAKLTAQPIGSGVRLNSEYKNTADGVRYYIYDGTTYKNVDILSVSGTNTIAKSSKLENGKLYYAYARPFKVYNNNILLGPRNTSINFVPVPAPNGVSVNFINNTTASLSYKASSADYGIKVLYRPSDGSIRNGCEALSNTCSISNLNSNNTYEFYLMRYKVVNGKKHYSSGESFIYNPPTFSTLARPEDIKINVGNNTWSFTIKKSDNAEGISVLYRVNEGGFSLGCEKAASSCSFDLTTDKTYTFYIMQYRTENGKKLYSPGAVVKNLYGAKTVSGDEILSEYVEVNENIENSDLYNALEDYQLAIGLTDYEVMSFLNVDFVNDYVVNDSDIYNYFEDNVDLVIETNVTQSDNNVIADYVPAEEDFIDVPTGDSSDVYTEAETDGNEIKKNTAINEMMESTTVSETETGIAFYTISDEPVQLDAPSFRNK